MSDITKDLEPHMLKKKMIIAVIILVIAAIATALLVSSVKTKEVLAEPGESRPPVEILPYNPIELTDPQYATPSNGTGVSGPEVEAKKMDPAYFEPLVLPYIDEPNLKAGNGFNVMAEGLQPGATFTAVAYPKGSSAKDPLTVKLGAGETDNKGKLSMIATTPTNLGIGSYIIEVSGPGKTFTTPFVIRP